MMFGNHMQERGCSNLEFVEPSTRLRSAVWKYFGFYKYKNGQSDDETHFDKTLCKLCNNLLAYNTGCTTNMRQHLIRSHDILPEELVIRENKNCKTSINNSSTNRKSVEPVDNQDISNKLKSLHDHDDYDEENDRCFGDPTSTKADYSHEIEPTHTTTSRKSAMLTQVDKARFDFVAPSSSLKALVWKYFGFCKEKNSNEAKFDRTWCKLCDQLMVYSGGNTTNMRSHLTRHHGIILDSLSPNSSKIISGTIDLPRQISNSGQKSPLVWEKFHEKYEFVPAKPHLKASVWRYFGFYKDIDSDEVKYDSTCCKLCKALVKYCSNTSNMRKHMHRYHDIILPVVGSTELPINDSIEKRIYSLKELKVSKITFKFRQ